LDQYKEVVVVFVHVLFKA